MGCASSSSMAGGGYASFSEAVKSGVLPRDTTSIQEEALYSRYFMPMEGLGALPAHGKDGWIRPSHVGDKEQKDVIVGDDEDEVVIELVEGVGDNDAVDNDELVRPLVSAAYCVPYSQDRRGQKGKPHHFLALGIKSSYDGKKGFRPPLRCVMIVDGSGAMGMEATLADTDGESRFDNVLAVLKGMMDEEGEVLHDDDEVAVILASSESRVLCDFTRVEYLRRDISRVMDGVIPFGPWDCTEGMRLAGDLISAAEEKRKEATVGERGGEEKEREKKRSECSSRLNESSEGKNEDNEEKRMRNQSISELSSSSRAHSSPFAYRVFLFSSFSDPSQNSQSSRPAWRQDERFAKEEAVLNQIREDFEKQQEEEKGLSAQYARDCIEIGPNLNEVKEDSSGCISAPAGGLSTDLLVSSVMSWTRGDKERISSAYTLLQIVAEKEQGERRRREKDMEELRRKLSLKGHMRLLATCMRPPVHTTLFPVGYRVDMGLVEHCCEEDGANYLSLVHPGPFLSILQETFEFIVTPVAKDLHVEIQSSPFTVQAVFGAPISNKLKKSSQGIDRESILHVPTIFPSPVNLEKGLKGGVILLQLVAKRPDEQDLYRRPITIVYSYTDLCQHRHISRRTYKFPTPTSTAQASTSTSDGLYTSLGIRKAIMLHSYSAFVRTTIQSADYNPGKLEKLRQWFIAEAEACEDKELLKEMELFDSVGDLLKENYNSGCIIS